MCSWSDLPIPYVGIFECQKCQRMTPHTCVAYKDVEYRTCVICRTHTEWTKVPAEKFLQKTGEDKSADWKNRDDERRTNPRKYRPRLKAKKRRRKP